MYKFSILLCAAGSALLGGCATLPAAKPGAVATLEARSGSAVAGEATFTASAHGLRLHLHASGLEPGSEHGLHIHDKGDCSAADASSAGPHWNPAGAPHGRRDAGPHHLGDLGAVVADAAGQVTVDMALDGLTLADPSTGVVGHSVVLHRDRDDFVTQPAGNAGPRVACGVIRTP